MTPVVKDDNELMRTINVEDDNEMTPVVKDDHELMRTINVEDEN